MPREQLRQQATETLLTLSGGRYVNPEGDSVTLTDPIRIAVERSELWTPDGLATLLAQRPARDGPRFETEFVVTNQTTLEAASYHGTHPRGDAVLCLNFASGTKPGGGFARGAQAQEESLARASALYPTLAAHPGFYDANRASGTALYTDHVIHSPDVPVFRDDDGTYLSTPYDASFLTAPAVNAGLVRRHEPHRTDEILPTMARRIARILTLAEHLGYVHLILGAWGCGVFRNDPAAIARMFADELRPPGRLAGRFRTVRFAVLDRAPFDILRPFQRTFASR